MLGAASWLRLACNVVCMRNKADMMCRQRRIQLCVVGAEILYRHLAFLRCDKMMLLCLEACFQIQKWAVKTMWYWNMDMHHAAFSKPVQEPELQCLGSVWV